MHDLADTTHRQLDRESLVSAVLVVEVTLVGNLQAVIEELWCTLGCLFLILMSHLWTCLNELKSSWIGAHHEVANVTCPSTYEVLRIEATAYHAIEHHQCSRDIALDGSIGETEEELIVEDIQIADCRLIGQFATSEARNLVEDRQRIAHTAISLLGDDLKCLRLCLDAFLRSDIGELSHYVLIGDALEVVGLATAEDSRQDLLLLGRGHDEKSMLWRLFESLEEGIECRLRKHVNLIDDEDLVLTYLWRDLHLLDEFADVIDTVVARSIEFVDVI